MKVIEFGELLKVIDIFPNTRFENPRIKLMVKNQISFEWPSNTFPVFSYKKRKMILLLLKSKGVHVEIKSDFEKEKNILE